MLLYRIRIDRDKCSGCGRCEEHWPGITKRFNCQGYFDLTGQQMDEHGRQFAWAFNLCPGKDGVTEAISREVRRAEACQDAKEV